MNHRRRGTVLFLWLFAISLLAGFPAQPAQAAAGHNAGKSRPGPLCQPVAALLNGAETPEPDPSEAQPSSGGAVPSQPSAMATPVNHDVCVAAHVYQVVELPDGTRFLDVCPSAVPDADCRFILLSQTADREEVGDLRRLSGTDIQLRGTLRQIHGRFGIYLSHMRQLQGGPEKFRPNPRLLQDFDASSDRLAVRDPNLRGSGRRRSFMNRSLRGTARSAPEAASTPGP